nr:S41 family peptidase [uncultured Dyadobacter sp.]
MQTVVFAGGTRNDDPEYNFETFWKLFDKHYAHFETRQIDWKKQYDNFRAKVSPSTTQEQLLAIFNDMVSPLKDGHVVISATGNLPASAKYAPFFKEFPTKDLQAQFRQVTLDMLLRNGFGSMKKFRSQPYDIGGYCRSADFGYLQLNGFGGMPLDDFSQQLDEMIIEFADVKGLIIDIRINGGGSPAYLEALAGRLTEVKRLVGYGRTRISRNKYEYSPWKPYYINPAGKSKLIKPTILLTSGSTISAGDHCALYLKEFPYIKQVGENTNGIFSPMLGKRLPNGWEIALSNGQTVSSRRISYEGGGVPVDIAVIHRRAHLAEGIDKGLLTGLSYLREHLHELALKTICFEQLAVNFYADSLLPGKTYGDVAAYSTGLVEEDATLLTPFANKCKSLNEMDKSGRLMERVGTEQHADSRFYQNNVERRFYVGLRRPIRSKSGWHLRRRNGRNLTVAHHITLGENHYVRLHLSTGGWNGETVLIVIDNAGKIVEHCFVSYNYLRNQPFI